MAETRDGSLIGDKTARAAYEKPVLQDFGTLHMATRGSIANTGDGMTTMAMLPPGQDGM